MLQLVNAIIVIALAAFAMFAYEHGNLVPNRACPLVSSSVLCVVTHKCAGTPRLCIDMLPTTLGFRSGYQHTCMCQPAATREGRQQCVDHGGQPVPCCAWQPTPIASTYMGLTAVTLLWTVFLFSQVRRQPCLYVESGLFKAVLMPWRTICLHSQLLSERLCVVQMRTFVISGTVAQWYFSPRDSRARQVCLHPCRITQARNSSGTLNSHNRFGQT